jgi:hypothetical protein
VNEVERKR